MLMVVEKGIKGGMCYAIQKYAKSNNSMKIMIQILNHHISCIYMQTMCVDGQCLKSCL